MNRRSDEVSARQPTLLVVGPGNDFGMQLLARFAAEGFALGALTRTPETAERLRGDLSKRGANLRTEVADIHHETGFANAIQKLATQLRGIDCLIYNAKVSVRGSSLTTPPATLHETLRVNATGALAAIQAALPYMPVLDQPRIILTGGGFKDRPDSTRLALSVGKAALHALARASAPPLRRHGIHLRTIIFNGPVADCGPITPAQIAEFFWLVFKAPKGQVFRYPEGNRRQSPLFVDRPVL